ncbi:hypothetical protein NQ315_007457 [Exocentrus adspersus]|uniref:Uncharacterized protein n=1 Tax=Exocentrus adspersus TaxID=1586481 RepID=A0AAV8VHY1_9CUCU|nr:hypothetical protein NQ315_007457 [Exocentrus adspersus]
MTALTLNITDNRYNYGKFILDVLDDENVQKGEAELFPRTKTSCKTKKKTKTVKLDSAFVHYLVRELLISNFYRLHFLKKWTGNCSIALTVVLNQTKYDLIDYNWNERVFVLVRERCELEHALSWLSTLGGAFSALGDYFPNCADIAGKISINQLRLALRLGDPSIAARCRLYLSLSLIQKKRYKYARNIIWKEYQEAKKASVVDSKLLNMCRGIWAKLQYEHNIFRMRNTGLIRKLRNVVL